MKEEIKQKEEIKEWTPTEFIIILIVGFIIFLLLATFICDDIYEKMEDAPFKAALLISFIASYFNTIIITKK